MDGEEAGLTPEAAAITRTFAETFPDGAEVRYIINDYHNGAFEDGYGVIRRVPRPRPAVLDARVHKLKWPPTGENWYITLSAEDSRLREIFITCPDPAAREWVEALARVVTAVLRTTEDPTFLFAELKRIPSATGGALVPALRSGDEPWHAPSVVAAVGALMEAEHARLSAPRHERAQADYAARRAATPPAARGTEAEARKAFPTDDGLPWGFMTRLGTELDCESMWVELPKTPLLLANLGPPPFDVTLPSGEVRRVVHKP